MIFRMRSIRFPERLWQDLKAQGERENRSVNNLLETIANQYLSEKKDGDED